MINILKIAVRNLARYQPAHAADLALITLGIVAVLLFVAAAGSFKTMMIGQFTDAMLGHLQVHRRGYVASIDRLPLNLNMRPAMVGKVGQALKDDPDAVEAYSERIKLGAMFSNFTETTSIRVNGIDPEEEVATMPLLPGRHHAGEQGRPASSAARCSSRSCLPRNEGQGGRHRGAGRDQQGRVGQRQDLHRRRRPRKRHGTGRAGRLHPHRRCPRAAAHGGARGQRDRDAPEGAGAARRRSAMRSAECRPRRAPARNNEGEPALEVHTWEDLSPFSNIVADDRSADGIHQSHAGRRSSWSA